MNREKVSAPNLQQPTSRSVIGRGTRVKELAHLDEAANRLIKVSAAEHPVAIPTPMPALREPAERRVTCTWHMTFKFNSYE